MSKEQDWYRHHKFAAVQTYVITPTYDTEKELDEAVAKLNHYANGRIPQREFLRLLGVRQPIGSKEYRNDVLLDTGVKKRVQRVCDDKDGRRYILDYWYMQYDVENAHHPNTDKDPDWKDLNSYTR